MVLRICSCFNSGIIVVLYNPFLYEFVFFFTGGNNNKWKEQEGYRFPLQLLMPYNYTLRHAVKCYTNNNINREQLQSQCKLYRRKVLILQVRFRANIQKKANTTWKPVHRHQGKQKNLKGHISTAYKDNKKYTMYTSKKTKKCVVPWEKHVTPRHFFPN